MYYEVWTFTGKMIHRTESLADAERILGAWYHAKYIVTVDEDGERTLHAVRKELH